PKGWWGTVLASSSAGGCAMTKRKTLAGLIEDAIDTGATTVEDIHKSIADLPLKVLEESDVLRGPAKEVRRVQDHTIGAIYDLIRGINERVATLASELLAEASRRRGARAAEDARYGCLAAWPVQTLPPSRCHTTP